MSTTIKRAFLVGINYKGSQYELRGCINDVLLIKNILIKHYGYSDANILLLSDDTFIKPTAANIIQGWKWLLSKNTASDFLKSYIPLASNEKGNYFFHYSGHGSQVSDTNKDENDGHDETICPIDFLTAGMITDDVIRENLALKVSSNSKLVSIIDACHSESSFDLLWTVKVGLFGGFSLSKVGSYPATLGDVVMLSGCKDAQTSADIEIDGKGSGALTYSLVQVLKQANYNITCDDLLTNVRNYIKKNGLSSQIPCLSFGKSADISRKFSF